MQHFINIHDIKHAISEHELCLFYIKSQHCSVCDAMYYKIDHLIVNYPSVCAFYTDIAEEPLIASEYMVYSAPTMLLLVDGKEVFRSSRFINLNDAEKYIQQYSLLINN